MTSGMLFLYFLLFGFIGGATLTVGNAICFIFKNNYIVRCVCDLITSLFWGLLFLYATNKFNSGEIRWFLVSAFVIGIVIEHKTLGKLFAKCFLLLYNLLNKSVVKFKTSRIGQVFTK